VDRCAPAYSLFRRLQASNRFYLPALQSATLVYEGVDWIDMQSNDPTLLTGENDASLFGLASQLQQAGKLEKAVAIYQLIVGRTPRHVLAYCNMAAAFAAQNRYEDAIKALLTAVQVDPTNVDAHFGLANCYTARGNLEEAVGAYKRAVALKPDFAEAHFRLGSLLSETGHVAEGFAHYLQRAKLAHGAREALPTERTEPPHRIKHDREQQEYLRLKYGRTATFHLENGERLTTPTVNPENATAAVLDSWKTSDPQFVVIDNFLMPEALEKLRLYCAGSTIWRRNYNAGYMGATPEDGLACPLMAQIAEEISATYPEILASHPFRYLGAFKYDSSLSTGTNIHGDNSAVNFNLYIAPDEANLDQESGGMDIWDVAVPADVDMRVYNSNDSLARRYLLESGAQVTRIPHRANRAILFRSDLFHKTSDCKFNEGFLNKRINISLLFGNRGASTR
jgi:tetratricopeptide (TPR) repeat protein